MNKKLIMMNRIKIYLLVAALSIVNCQLSTAQEDVPTPAPKQTEKICLKGGTVHVGNGKVIENAYVVFENGKISEVFAASDVKTEATLGKVIDVTGKQIYPGLISLNTILGLIEIEAARATNDVGEVGSANSDARAITSVSYTHLTLPTNREV